MKTVIQRVTRASVSVEGKTISGIGRGLLLLVGVGKEDTEKDAEALAVKIAGLRIFEDDAGKMNLDIRQAGGEILSVPQFTLLADTRKGNRPSFDNAAKPENALALWREFNRRLREKNINVSEGVFGAHMLVELTNDGPVTLTMGTDTAHRRSDGQEASTQ